MFDNLKILCLHGSIIVNTDNDIIYNGGSHEFHCYIGHVP